MGSNPTPAAHPGREGPTQYARFVWLVLVTPDADSLVGTWRAEHDPAARFGIPAHVTVRTPFLAPERWGDPSPEPLDRFLPVDVTLARLENRPGGLVILVEPDDALRALTDAVGRSWPSLPPHKDNRPDLAYHVTVVRTDDERIRSKASEAIEPELPLRVAGTELWAVAGSHAEGLLHAVVAPRRAALHRGVKGP